MSIFGISDLHLSFGSDKPMDIFPGWNNHTDRIRANWKRLITENDTVVLPGDLSWALKLEDTKKDFEFLKSLPGKKILLKGNHDLWWNTRKKIHEFFAKADINDVEIVYNNCVVSQGYAVAGTRGWFYDDPSNKKVLLREAGRLNTSLSEAEKTGLPILTFLHYPPVYGDYNCPEILDILKKHNIHKVFYGHIHGAGFHKAVAKFENIEFKLLSCDCLDFTPLLIV